MSDSTQGPNDRSDDDQFNGELLKSVQEAMAAAKEADRFRFLGKVLEGFAEHAAAKHSSQQDPIQKWQRKARDLELKLASLTDELRMTKAEFNHEHALRQAEQEKSAEQKKLIAEARTRLGEVEQDREHMQSELVAKNTSLHKAQSEVEGLTCQLQRLEAGHQEETGRIRIAASQQDLNARYVELQAELENLRHQKNEEIAAVNRELAAAKSAAESSSEGVLLQLFERLSRAEPPLADLNRAPTLEAGQRLTDGFIRLVKSMHDLEDYVVGLIHKKLARDQRLGTQWEAFYRSERIRETAKQVVAVSGGTSAGVLYLKLRTVSRWFKAVVSGYEGTISDEQLAEQLEEFLRGEHGTKRNHNRTIKDFLKDDGHLIFAQKLNHETLPANIAGWYATLGSVE